jgi:hypothetical protein
MSPHYFSTKHLYSCNVLKIHIQLGYENIKILLHIRQCNEKKIVTKMAGILIIKCNIFQLLTIIMKYVIVTTIVVTIACVIKYIQNFIFERKSK